MSQQLQITGGAKVRSLEGVITGSTGVLGSLPINGSNGIPQLDVNGKILVSQLPNSVMEYLGTWNAATNTPTLVNGTGNAGDVYLCNVAGTVNFGAGPITFGVGDQVIYSGTIWQKASGSTGTVTSVAVTETGDALTITGSPITTSGTINIGFAGTSAQYVAGNGTLVTFPTITTEAQRLITEVYNETGATLTKGTVVYINGGHGNLPTVTKSIANSDATSAQTYGVVQSNITNNNNGFVVVIGSLMDLDTQAYANGTQLYLSSTVAGAWTSTKQYAPAHLVYVAIVTRSHPTQGVVEVRIQNGFELDELHDVSAQTPSNNQGIFYNSSTSLWENKSIATALGYTPANAADLSNYVTLATSQVITGAKVFDGSAAFSATGGVLGIEGGASVYKGLAIAKGFPPSIFVTGFSTLYSASGNNNAVFNDNSNTSKLQFQATSSYTYTFPANTGTIALTSDIPSGGITAVTATSPLFSSGGTTPNITIQVATSGQNGYLSSTDWNTFNGKQNALTNPITGTGSGGRIPYFSGTTTLTSTANLNWDNSNNFITTSGVYVFNNTTNAYILTSNGDNVGTMFNVSATRWGLGYSLSPSTLATAALSWNSEGRVSIGNTNNTYNLDVTGTGRFTGTILAGAANGNIRLTGATTDGFIGVNTSTMYLTDWDTAAKGMTINLTNGNTTISGSVTANKLIVASNVNSGTIDFGTSIYKGILDYTAGTGLWKFNNQSAGSSSTLYYQFQADGTPIVSMLKSGNVGIGITNPTQRFQVYSTASTTSSIFETNSVNSYIALKSTTGTNYIGNVSSAMTFEAGGAERMRITSGGNVLIGTTTDSGSTWKLQVNSLIATLGTDAALVYQNRSDSTRFTFYATGGYSYFFNGGNVSQINMANGVYTALSDINKKKDFEASTIGLKEVLQLKPTLYRMKSEEDTEKHLGFIAQEVKEFIPQAYVESGKEGNKFIGLDYQAITTALVKAIQELEARIKTLENK